MQKICTEVYIVDIFTIFALVKQRIDMFNHSSNYFFYFYFFSDGEER